MIEIKLFEDRYWPELWEFMEAVFRLGDSYPVSPDITEADAKAYWVNDEKITYVALNEEGRAVGLYYIRPNQPTLGAHVCNCGYIVDARERGQGIASKMCLHSQTIALELGYSAMQYNLVVATNTAAVKLWQRQGFDIIGTLPKAFQHKTLGLVDAHIMYKLLD